MKDRSSLRILAVLMAVAMVCMLAACGNKDAGGTNPTESIQPSDNPTTGETGDNGDYEDAITDTPDATEGTVEVDVTEPSEETEGVEVTEPSEETQPKDDPDPAPSTQPENVIDFEDLLNAGRG